jgi:G3E family GTPase
MPMIPVVILATVDPVLREAALLSLLTDQPGTGVLRQDLDPGAGALRRVISDEHGVVEDETRPLEHTCLGCAIREDSLPALETMVASGRWDRIVWALPVSAQTLPAARSLCERGAVPGVELATVACVVDADRIEHDLMGDELLADRNLALALDDRRSVGEAVAAQLGHADLLLTIGSDPMGLTLADHLRGRRTMRSALFGTRAEQVFAPRHSPRHAEARVDPCRVQAPDAPDAHGVWSLDLLSPRPVHPGRFLAGIDELAGGRTRSRGRFHLPTRPGRVGVWDGAGRQLSIGDGGRWRIGTPSTRLVFTGVADDRARVVQAFARMLMTDAELATAARPRRADDGLDAWLGAR